MRPVSGASARLDIRCTGWRVRPSVRRRGGGREFVAELYVDLDYDPAAISSSSVDRTPRPRVTAALATGCITAIDGTALPVRFDSICVHSDTLNCVEVATAVRKALGRRDRGMTRLRRRRALRLVRG